MTDTAFTPTASDPAQAEPDAELQAHVAAVRADAQARFAVSHPDMLAQLLRHLDTVEMVIANLFRTEPQVPPQAPSQEV